MSEAWRLTDLFAGAGGMTRGFTADGRFRIVQAVEHDEQAAATYGANHGSEHLYTGGIEDWLQQGLAVETDVIIGGPPCQGFSALGRQDVADERNFLWKQYAKTIVAARPKYFVLENVAQFLKSDQFSEFDHWTTRGELLSDYALQPYILNAADFGSAQARRRAVVVGYHRDLEALPEPVTTHEGRRRTVRDAFKGVRKKVEIRDLPSRTVTVNGKEFPGTFTTKELHVTRFYQDLSLKRFAKIPAGGNRFDLPEELKAPCWRKHVTGSADVMGRLRLDTPSVTIRTEFFKPEKGRYIHPTEDRAITHYEAARLQGFPDDYRWVGSKIGIARQIGNAVPVPLASALASLVSGGLEASSHPRR